MEHQPSFAAAEFARKKKVTRREKFLAEMEAVVPWTQLCALIQPFYPKGERGRPPIGLERMLRLYFLQQWFGLADEALEDALYDSHAFGGFARIALGHDPVPDATTLLNFRHLLERHQLTRRIFECVTTLLEERHLWVREGTTIDATIIAAPSSTKNQKRQRDLEMHQTKKGNQWYFGMKAHIGAALPSGIVHSLATTAANGADVTQAAQLLHGQEKHACVDAGYQGVEKRPEVIKAHSKVEWHVAARRHRLHQMPEGPLKQLTLLYEQTKAKARAVVEHPFHVLKDIFHYRKVRYRGLAKNTAQLYALFALVNLYRNRHALQAAA